MASVHDRMWTADCLHGAWRVLMLTEHDDGTPPTGRCPQGCELTLSTIEPGPRDLTPPT